MAMNAMSRASYTTCTSRSPLPQLRLDEKSRRNSSRTGSRVYAGSVVRVAVAMPVVVAVSLLTRLS